MENLNKIAESNSTVLITGRTGTGKSHLAKQIHMLSRRRDKKYVAINLATLSENLIESELFGHEKGAFSGADFKRMGKIEQANGGTVFLDEIGELSPRLQTKLLEALNSFTICPVGSNREIPVDIRIIAATNQNLVEQISKGLFREDLYYRLNTFEIQMPDLSSSPAKIVPLALRLAKDSAFKQNREFLGFTSELESALKSHNWPGNIRELKNVVEYGVALSTDGNIGMDCLPNYMRRQNSSEVKKDNISYPSDYRTAKTLFERRYLEDVLLRFDGKINRTAKESGLSKVTLIDKIRKYEINIPKIKFESHEAKRSYL